LYVQVCSIRVEKQTDKVWSENMLAVFGVGSISCERRALWLSIPNGSFFGSFSRHISVIPVKYLLGFVSLFVAAVVAIHNPQSCTHYTEKAEIQSWLSW
jgi:hypothetical protein